MKNKSFYIRLAKGLLLAVTVTLGVTIICGFIALMIGDTERFIFTIGFIAGSVYWITLLTYVFYNKFSEKDETDKGTD